jgi:hypothetical protein
MKKKIRPKPKQRKKHPVKARRTARPREVYQAIRKLLDTTNHIQARAAELENALDVLREQEQIKAVKAVLVALRNSPDGDLLRFGPVVPGGSGTSTAQAVVAALVEAFAIAPIHEIGEQIPVRHGEIPDSLELDRSIGEDAGKCVAAEIISAGWRFKKQTLLKPVVRPVFTESSQHG